MSHSLLNVHESSTLAVSYYLWIRKISQIFMTLSSNPASTALRIQVNEKEKVSDNKVITCCKLCSSSVLKKSDLLFALSQNFAMEAFHSLLRDYYQSNKEELSIVFEITNLEDDTTTILRAMTETNGGGLKIIEKTRNKLRSDGVNAIMQITGIVEIKETMYVCLKLHDYMYKLRAFSEIGHLKFSASVDGTNFSNEFIPGAENHDASSHILTSSSHYFKNSEEELDFTLSAPTTISFPESLKFDRTISFQLMTACCDRPDMNDQTALINLYFVERLGLYESNGKISSSAIGSIFPFVRLGITINDIDFHPTSNGLVTPDTVLLAAKPGNFPNSCIVLLRISCDNSMEPKDTIQIMSAITNNFELILSHNASVIQATFLYNMGRSLDRHFQAKTQQKLSSDLETGISLTVSSTRDIVSMSPNPAFREACFSLFNVDNAHSLGIAIVDKLMTIANAKEEGTSRKRRHGDDENVYNHT